MTVQWKLFGACLAQEAGMLLHSLGHGLRTVKRRLPLLLFVLFYTGSGGYIAYRLALYLASAVAGPAGYTPAPVMAFGLLASMVVATLTTPLIMIFGGAIERYQSRKQQRQGEQHALF